MEAALVSSEPAEVAAVQLVVVVPLVVVVGEQALVAAEEAQVLPLAPVLLRLQTPDRRQAQL